LNYDDALQFLSGRHAKDMKLGLENIRSLLARLDNPERRFKSVHIAGTNGKGSTTAMLESILRESGYRTGLYTSPHLVDIRERIRIGGVAISRRDFLLEIADIQAAAEETNASFFEILTAVGFKVFADRGVDIAVVETGLGGRLDATNLITPELAVITEIGLDHTRILGTDMETIAAEKAGILKPGVPAVIGTQITAVKNFFEGEGKRRGAVLRYVMDSVKTENIRLAESGTLLNAWVGDRRFRDLRLRLLGAHQVENAATVLLIVDELRSQGWAIPERAVYDGLAKTVWRARLELLQIAPKIVLDSAHNGLGAKRLAHAIEEIFLYRNLTLVFGVLSDKDYGTMAEILFPLADRIILTRPDNERALDPYILAELPVCRGLRIEISEEIGRAWEFAMKRTRHNDLVCAAGSIYFVGEILRLMGENACGE